MADGKVFSKETKKFLVDAADAALKLPFYAEPFDGPFISWVINWIDAQGDKVIPDTLDPALNQVVMLCAEKKWDEASEVVGTTINELVDIPGLPEEVEQQIFVDAMKLIVRLVQVWVKGKKENS